MSKLPSFDDLDNNESQDNFSPIDELLAEFEGNEESKTNHQNDDLGEPDFNSDFESFVKVEDNEDTPNNNEWNDEEFQDSEDEFNNESLDELNTTHENSDEAQEAERSEGDEHEDDYEDDYEPEDSFMGALLPGMESESETGTTDEPEDENTGESENIYESETPSDDEIGADEKAKEIFVNLKDKILGLLKPKGRSSPKENNRQNKINKKTKAPIKFNKNQKMILLASVSAIAVLVIIVFSFMKSHSSLEDISANAKFNDKDFDEKIEVNIENLKSNGEEITATIKNESDTSATISSSLTLKEKSFIPFLGNKIQCESDIVHVETDGEAKETFSCEGEVDSTKKYKVNAEIDKF